MIISAVAFAQPQGQGRPNWQERIQSAKIAFLTNEMQLTPEEAQAFWPIYNKAQKEQNEAFENTLRAYGELDKAVRENKSDAVIAKALHAYTDAASAQDHVSEKYVREYEKVLPSTKVAKLYIGEEKFRLNQIRNLGAPNGGFGGPNNGAAPPQGGNWSGQKWPRQNHTDKAENK